jgi:hypothetical protein
LVVVWSEGLYSQLLEQQETTSGAQYWTEATQLVYCQY